MLDTNNVIVIWNTPKPTSKPTLRPTTKRPTPLPTIRNTSNPSPRPSTRRPTRNPTLRPTPQPTIKPPISFKSFIGGQFFNDERSNEASGLALAPDKSHLIVVSDNGKIFFLNLLDYNSGHCVWEDDDVFNDNTDFEGVAIVPNEWSQNNKIAYLIHEGADDDRPYLYKIGYTYNSDLGSCSVQLVESYSLRGALPCLTTSDGIESLTWKVGTSNPAVFYVGVEDTGRIYEITSDGNSNGDVCFDGGMGRDGISSLVHDGTYLWSVFGEDGKLAVIDPARDGCTLAVIDIPRQGWDTEGLVIDFENNLMYRAVDEGGDSDPSIVAVYDFTYNIENKECISDMMPLRSCSGFTLCGR